MQLPAQADQPGHEQAAVALSLLRRWWPRWMEVVELFARRRGSRHRVKQADYAELYEAICGACQVLVEQANDEARRAVYQRMAQLIRPWVSPQALSFADREVATNLLVNCRDAYRQLTGRSAAPGLLSRTLMICALAVALGLGAVMAAPYFRGGAGASLPVSEQTKSFLYLARYHFRRTTLMQRVLVGGTVITVLTIGVVWKSARQY